MGLDQRSERPRSGGGAAEAPGGQGVPRNGERAQLRRLLDQFDAVHSHDGDAARPAARRPDRYVEHARGDHRMDGRHLGDEIRERETLLWFPHRPYGERRVNVRANTIHSLSCTPD